MVDKHDVEKALNARKRAKQKRNGRITLEILDQSPRTCGECQVCCVIAGVGQVNKPRWHRCQYQCEKGCGIHERKPWECKNYGCGWLLNLIGGDRPDRSGLFVSCGEVQGGLSWEVAWGIHEVWPFALASRAAVDLVNQVAEFPGAYVELIPYRPEGSTDRELVCLALARYRRLASSLEWNDFEAHTRAWLSAAYARIACLNQEEGREVAQ